MNKDFKITKTELVWPGKRTKVEPIKLPFQTIEVINLPRGRRQANIFDHLQKQASLIPQPEQKTLTSLSDKEWKNRLIWGDNFLIMSSLLDEFAGKINLIYIDPPFATGQDFSYQVNIGDEKWTKEPSAIEELAYLKVGTKKEGKKIIVTLEDFILENPELIPLKVREKIKNWSDFIDYWAVDWLFNQHSEEKSEEDDLFHNMNQEYRTRKNPKLNLSMSYDYPKPGKYNILVKVIDIFGNDTTKLAEVKV